MKRAALALVLFAAGCGGGGEPAPQPSDAPALGEGRLPPQAGDFPALASTECTEVVEFYLEALGGREWEHAALVWDDPVVDADRLEAVFGGYRELQVEWNEPFVQSAAGSLHCTVSGKLTDARDPAKPMLEGTLLLQRVDDAPGAAQDEPRWMLRSSTFAENLARSTTGEP